MCVGSRVCMSCVTPFGRKVRKKKAECKRPSKIYGCLFVQAPYIGAHASNKKKERKGRKALFAFSFLCHIFDLSSREKRERRLTPTKLRVCHLPFHLPSAPMCLVCRFVLRRRSQKQKRGSSTGRKYTLFLTCFALRWIGSSSVLFKCESFSHPPSLLQAVQPKQNWMTRKMTREGKEWVVYTTERKGRKQRNSTHVCLVYVQLRFSSALYFFLAPCVLERKGREGRKKVQ